jgi:hypothetical protein
MKIARLFGGSVALCALATAGVLYAGSPARSFDFQTSPTVVAKPAADITDTYFFPSPTNPDNVVAVMDVYPLIPAGQGLNTYFNQGVLYTMKFDNKYAQESVGARPVEDEVIQFSFGPPGNGTQAVYVYGPLAPVNVGAQTRLVNSGTYSGHGFINRPFIAAASYYGDSPFSVFAGARRDPTFFNASQFFSIFPNANQGSTATTCLPSGADTCPQGFGTAQGTDLFVNTNVLSIVIEIPKFELSGANSGVVAYWATTSTSSGK